MAELVKGIRYRIKNLHVNDAYKDDPRALTEAVLTEQNGSWCRFKFDDGYRTFLNGFTVEECCGEGCCELPPKKAEFATM